MDDDECDYTSKDEDEIGSEYGSEDAAAHEESDAIRAIRISHRLDIVSTPFESSVYKQLRSHSMKPDPSDQEKIPQEEIQRCMHLSLDPSHIYRLHGGLRLLLYQ